MVAPERQRQGLGDVLFRTWDRNTGASLGLGLSDSSYRLFQKMRWPDVGPVPCLVKPLSRRALRRPNWPVAVNRLVSYVTLPWIRLVVAHAAAAGRGADDSPFRRALHAPLGAGRRASSASPSGAMPRTSTGNTSRRRTCATRSPRSSATAKPPATSSTATRQEPRGRVTLLVDFLTDPADDAGIPDAAALGRSRGARRRLGQDPHVRDARRIPQAAAQVRLLLASSRRMEFVAKVNAVEVPAGFYKARDRWHVTLGDSDQDR